MSHIVTTLVLMSLFAPSMVRQMRYSCFLSRYSRTSRMTSLLDSMSIASLRKYLSASSKVLIICIALTVPIHLILERSSIERFSLFSSIILWTFLASENTLIPLIPLQSIVATSSHHSSFFGQYLRSFSRGCIWGYGVIFLFLGDRDSRREHLLFSLFFREKRSVPV